MAITTVVFISVTMAAIIMAAPDFIADTVAIGTTTTAGAGVATDFGTL
jgi:hypothetical protein